MKKLRLTALFIGLSAWGFAQTPFTEATLNDIHQGFTTDAVKTFDERVAANFQMIGDNGKITDYATFRTWQVGGGLTEWPTSEVKIQQAGNLAVATGITRHKPKNAKNAFYQRFTEIYTFKDGKWLLASAHYTDIIALKAEEEAAIKQLLVDERKAFYAGDKDGVTKFWTDNPRTFVNASFPSGHQFYMNQEAVKKSIATFKPNDNATGTITSSQVKVYGKAAMADIELTTNYKNGMVAKAHDIILLEKEGSEWKILGHSSHGIPADKKDEEEAIKKMLDEEKKASDAADFKAYKSHWVEAPYVSFQYNGLSLVGDAFWKSAEERFAGRKPTNMITTRSDWNFTIKGAAAFVTFSQKAENVEKKTTSETYEERYVEKVKGEWKMVNMTAIKKAN